VVPFQVEDHVPLEDHRDQEGRNPGVDPGQGMHQEDPEVPSCQVEGHLNLLEVPYHVRPFLELELEVQPSHGQQHDQFQALPVQKKFVFVLPQVGEELRQTWKL